MHRWGAEGKSGILLRKADPFLCPPPLKLSYRPAYDAVLIFKDGSPV
jgi:hypothetical protein